MTITALQVTGITQDSATAAAKAFVSNVATGSLVVVAVARYSPGTTPTAGDCTKSAGTATLGAITLDKVQVESGTNNMQTAIWSAVVTAGGSLTMSVAGAAGSYFAMGLAEFSSTVGWNNSRVETTGAGTGASATPTTSTSLTSAGAALFFGNTAFDGTSNDTSISEAAGFTRVYRETDASLHEPGDSYYKIVASGTTSTINSVAGTSAPWAVAGVVYKEGAGGAATPSAPPHLLNRNRQGFGLRSF